MADKYSKPRYYRKNNIPKELNWENLQNKSGTELETQHITILNNLSHLKHKTQSTLSDWVLY